MEITIPEEVFGIKKWEATVVRNYNVASFIKEFVVEIPEDMGYKAVDISRLKFLNVKLSLKKWISQPTQKSMILQINFRQNGTSLDFGH